MMAVPSERESDRLMRRALLGLAVVLCGCSSPTSGAARLAPSVVAVRYQLESGPILPERQWSARYDITAAGVRLERAGKVARTQVNAGAWPVPSDEAHRRDLLTRLAAARCTDLRRIEPNVAPDGGRTESLTIVYGDGSTCDLLLEPGVIYEGGDALLVPTRAFVADLQLPAEAASELRTE